MRDMQKYRKNRHKFCRWFVPLNEDRNQGRCSRGIKFNNKYLSENDVLIGDDFCRYEWDSKFEFAEEYKEDNS